MIRLKWSHILSAAVAASALLSACTPAAVTPGVTQVVVTSPPIVQTQIVNGTPETIIVTATPGPTDVPAATPLPEGAITLNGAGATFPDPLYTEWRFAYQYIDPSVVINYQAIGSGGGKKAIADKTVDFAGSDSLLSDDEYAANPTLQMFPMVAGAEVIIYNIAEITQGLTIDGATLAGIYAGDITRWNDPALVALNPDLPLPDQAINAVHRSDGSGTTEIFTRFLSKVSEAWASGPGFGSAIEWPVDAAGTGIGGKGNAGVAAAVQNTPYSLGYVESSYAVANKINYAAMVNAAGTNLTYSAEALQSAMADYGDGFSDKLTIDSISNGPGENSWPIAGYTYMVIYTDMAPDATYGCVKAEKYLNFIHWALTDEGAAARASQLGYAALPEAVRERVFDTLAQVTCDGQPIQSEITASN
jgi:phosphate transport system substrate-binding protein